MIERRDRDSSRPNGVAPLELSAKRVSLDSVESPAASSWASLGQVGGSMDGASQMALASEFDDDDSGGVCGLGPCRPRFLQRFRSPKWMLICLCFAGALQGMVVNGFVNVIITTIERRYDLRSTETGLIAGAYDIASFLCLVPVSYIGGAGRKPRWIGLGMLVLAVGSFLFATPHFTSDHYTFALEAEHLCESPSSNDTSTTSTAATNSTRTCVIAGLSRYKYVFFFGQFLHGAGAAPLYTLGVAFLDENVTTKMSSVFIGTYYAMAIIGPAIGYLLGGQFLKIYVDIGAQDPSRLGVNPSSNVWVGAWWIGFLLSGSLAILLAIPILAFPKALPGAKRIQSEKVSEAHRGAEGEGSSTQMGFTRIRALPKALKGLCCNPCFMFLNFAGACEALLLNGFAAFLPKYIESQFSMEASWAALLVGAVTIPTGGGGTFLGGYLVKRFSLRCAGIIKLCICVTLVALLCTLVFLIDCPNIPFAGVNSDESLQSACSKPCQCSENQYDPVCGNDNTMYYSPCFAGCHVSIPDGDKKWYSNCSCISHPGRNVTIGGQPVSVMASGDKCVSSCNLLVPFLGVALVFMLFTFLASMPALSATLRCVSSSQRSFSLGIQWLLVRALGSIPAPVLFGALMDSTCILWQDSCGVQGSCRAYDNASMSRIMMTVAMVGKGVSLFCFFMAWLVYRPPHKAGVDANAASALPTIGSARSKLSDGGTIRVETDDSGYSAGSITQGKS